MTTIPTSTSSPSRETLLTQSLVGLPTARFAGRSCRALEPGERLSWSS
jgi:hypothetical protein